ncbi:tetratricopeptide repeat protein [Shewanella avicenniae]|uniref:Tetratricopeptide repeat protein n=1 Tax=Shewanella avicenniae TaxID=2814294 RepID=A0ABX7QLP0_9GAMM|nr:tetratricopeptide repeat protein [Shewanella avicenniae]QSX32372.1 tetratricopeptide repeat protein [Shewanella avicenniae]
MGRYIACFSLLVLIAGCATQTPTSVQLVPPVGNSFLFNDVTSAASVPEPETFYRIAEADTARFFAFSQTPAAKPLPKYQQLTLYLHQLMENYSYEGENFTAAEALQKKRGNCMTLAMLTYALAKSAKVNIGFVEVNAAPILLDVDDALAMYSSHVRALLIGEAVDGKPLGINAIDYFPDNSLVIAGGKSVDEATFMAMFYRNLASDAMLAGQPKRAYWIAMKGLAIAPQYTPLINMVGVLHRQAGDNATAIQFYEYGLAIDPNDSDILNNYHIVALAENDQHKAQALARRLDAVIEVKPIAQYLSALSAMNEGQYGEAKRLLRRFLKEYPYFHRAHLLLAQCQFALGNLSSAKRSLADAIQYAGDSGNKNLYSAKLAWLKDGQP